MVPSQHGNKATLQHGNDNGTDNRNNNGNDNCNGTTMVIKIEMVT